MPRESSSVVRSKPSIDFQPNTSYQRLLVHRSATYYKLLQETDGQSKTITVTITPESRMYVFPLARTVVS